MSVGELLLFGNVSQAALLQQPLSAAAGVPEAFPDDPHRAVLASRLRLDGRGEARPDPRRFGLLSHGSSASGSRVPGRRAPPVGARPKNVSLGHDLRGVRALGPSGPRGLARDRFRVQPLLHAGRADAAGVRGPRDRGAALRSRHRSRALPAAQDRSAVRRPVLREVDAVPQRPAGSIVGTHVRPAARIRRREAVDDPDAAAARHSRRAWPGPSVARGSPSRPRWSTTSTASSAARIGSRHAPSSRHPAACRRSSRASPASRKRSSPASRSRSSPRKTRSWPRRSKRSPTSPPVSPWAAAPASGRCASTRGIAGSRRSSWTSPRGEEPPSPIFRAELPAPADTERCTVPRSGHRV